MLTLVTAQICRRPSEKPLQLHTHQLHVVDSASRRNTLVRYRRLRDTSYVHFVRLNAHNRRTLGEWQCGVRRLAVANGPNIFQMLLVVIMLLLTVTLKVNANRKS